MLLPAQVVPFLLHADADVREHAFEYLARGHDPAPATAEDVWAAMDRYGDTPTRFGGNERARFASEVARFPATPRSMGRLLDTLRSDRTPEVFERLARAALRLEPETVRVLVTDQSIRSRLSAAMIAEIAAIGDM